MFEEEYGDVYIKNETTINNNNAPDFLHIGVLGILIDIICYLKGRRLEKKEAKYFKRKTYNPQKGTYLDPYCRERLYSDDSLVYRYKNGYGENIVSYQNGTEINLTQKEYDEIPGTVTKLTGYDYHNKSHFFKQAIGFRYKDRANGKIYVVRRLEYENIPFLFYMDVNNGMIIRPTDGQIKIEQEAKRNNKRNYSQDEFNAIIEYFNDSINNSRAELLFRNSDNASDINNNEDVIRRCASYRKDL